jgi:hypothetical protein
VAKTQLFEDIYFLVILIHHVFTKNPYIGYLLFYILGYVVIPKIKDLNRKLPAADLRTFAPFEILIPHSSRSLRELSLRRPVFWIAI